MKTIIAALSVSALLLLSQTTSAATERDASRTRGNADASAAGARANLGERELRGVYEYWRARPVQSGGMGRRH